MRRKFWLFALALFIGVRVVLSYVSTCGECNNTFVNVDGDNMTDDLFSTGYYGYTTIGTAITFEEGTVGSCPLYWDNCDPEDEFLVNESAGTELTGKVLQYLCPAGSCGLDNVKWEELLSNATPEINFTYNIEVTSVTDDTYGNMIIWFQLCQEEAYCSDRPVVYSFACTGAGTYGVIHWYELDEQLYDTPFTNLEYDKEYEFKNVIDYENNCTEYWIDGVLQGEGCYQFTYTYEEANPNSMGAFMFWTLNSALPVQWLVDNITMDFKTPINDVVSLNATKYEPVSEPLLQGEGAYVLYYDSTEETFCFFNSTGHINCLDYTPRWVDDSDH